MEVSLSLFTEVSGMAISQKVSEERALYLLFLHHDSVVMHTTSVTTTTSMLSVSTDTTVTHGHVSSHMSRLSQSCDLNRIENHKVSEVALDCLLVPHTISKIDLIITLPTQSAYIFHNS